MKFVTQTLLIYTKNNQLRKSIKRFIRYTDADIHKYYKFIFDNQINSMLAEANHFADIFHIFDTLNLVQLFNTILLIDIYSFREFWSNNLDDEENLLYDFILQYPEVKILLISSDKEVDLPRLETIIYDRSKNGHQDKVTIQSPGDYYPHVFYVGDLKRNLELAVAGKSNLFDFSGIRRAIKERMIYLEIKAEKDNFKLIHESRQKRIALVIDEEENQAYFNAYALYRYGYSVLPVINYRELQYLLNYKNLSKRSYLIVRDYDLQFEDYDIDGEKDILHDLRGYRKDEKNGKWVRSTKDIWSKFISGDDKDGNVFYVTKYDKKNTIRPTLNKSDNSPKIFCNFDMDNNSKINEDQTELCLRGLTKPLFGLMDLLDIVQKHIGDINILNGLVYCKEEMRTDRHDEDSGHAISPKILHIGESLIERAQRYMDENMYLVSAVLANESLEILNGFHFLKMLRALYIRTISETKLEVEIIGVRDDSANVHTKFREIKAVARRICRNNDSAYENILNQLAIDLRHIYINKELLESADACLREYVQNSEGINIVNVIKIVWAKFNRIKTG